MRKKHTGRRMPGIYQKPTLIGKSSFLFIVVLLWGMGRLSAQNIVLHLKNTHLAQVVTHLQKQLPQYKFSFQQEALEKVRLAEIWLNAGSLKAALEQLQQRHGLHYLLDGYLISFKYVPKDTTAPKKIQGKVTGKVIDEENSEPVADATVRIGNKSTVSAIDGSFSITLPKGTYEAEISSVGYGKKIITEIAVKEGGSFELNVALKREKGALEGVVVKGAARKESINALYARQKKSAAISDGISQEQIKVTPDNNAAQVLKRVSGVTVQDEKYVTVRGLSDRYNAVLLNGSVLPSTEPNRRNFAFDIIPSGLIDNIVINKTATPDLSSEFAGGLVQVNTKDVPVESYYNITLGTGINTLSAGKDMYSSKRGKNDYLGYDDGTKMWWQKNNWSFPEYVKALGGGSRELVGELGRQIPNNWGIYQYKYVPMQNYQFSIGQKLGLKNGASIGITAGGLFRHEENREEEARKSYTGDTYDFKGYNYVFRSSLGGVLNVAYQDTRNRIAFKNLYNHLFVNETSEALGPMAGLTPGTYHNQLSISYLTDMWQHRLEGEHALGKKGIKVDWSADRVTVTRDQPDSRNSMGLLRYDQDDFYLYEGLGDRTGTLTKGLSIFNSRLQERRYNWAANVVFPFTFGGLQQRIKAGYSGIYREADFESFGLAAMHYSQADLDPDFFQKIFGLPVEKLLTPEFIRPGAIYYEKAVYDGNDYDGIQRMQAGYLMLDAALLRKLRLIGGVRAEDNTMVVNSMFYVNGERVPNYNYHKLDWLPSANLVYALNTKMNIRAAMSQTLSRPDYRERAAFMYFEFKARNDYKGAVGLKDAKVTNVDFRYEYYPSAGEVLSLSLFYKHFASPVEMIATQGSSGLLYFYFNLKSAESKGLEIDFRKSLNFINPHSRLLSNIYLSGNASWLKSQVRYNGNALLMASNGVTGGNAEEVPGDIRNRALQGLSPNVYNASIGYVGKPVGLQVSYNRYGRRIVNAGLYPWQDEYENPRDVVDIQLNVALLKNKLHLRFNVSDLLQQPIVIYNNWGKVFGNVPTSYQSENYNNDPKGTRYNPDLDFTRYKARRGMNLSASATYNF